MNEPSSQPRSVVGPGGIRGVVESEFRDGGGSSRLRILLEDGRRVDVTEDLVSPGPNGSLRLNLPPDLIPDRASGVSDATGQAVVIPLAEERLHVSADRKPVSRVVVHVRAVERQEPIAIDLTHERADVRRVPVNAFVQHAPAAREENGEIVIPLVEEVLVVEKRLMVREEIRIRKEQITQREVQDVPLRSEEADITREPISGATRSENA